MQHHRLMAGPTQGAEHITTRTCARFPKLLKTKNHCAAKVRAQKTCGCLCDGSKSSRCSGSPCARNWAERAG